MQARVQELKEAGLSEMAEKLEAQIAAVKSMQGFESNAPGLLAMMKRRGPTGAFKKQKHTKKKNKKKKKNKGKSKKKTK